MSNIFVPPGVHPDIAAERGYRRVENKSQLAEHDYQLTQAQQQVPGLLIPVYRLGIHPSYTHVLRPDRPRLSDTGAAIKYEWPAGVPLCLDILPCFRDVLGDPTVEVWITEGAKKADALASAFGMTVVPININGVWGWMRKGKDGASHPLEDFDAITWDGRHCTLAFDNDIIAKPEVQRALKALARHLKDRGTTVRVLILPEVWSCTS